MNDLKLSGQLGRGALALALAAIAAPTAQARHAPEGPVATTLHISQVDAATRHHHPDVLQRPTRIIAVSHVDTFDWGDAGIGAAGALGATLVAAGTVALVKRNKNERAMTARLEA
jgi:hypothetical protein